MIRLVVAVLVALYFVCTTEYNVEWDNNPNRNTNNIYNITEQW